MGEHAGSRAESSSAATTLGWYEFNGRLYVTLDVVLDDSRFSEVCNHEMTHHLLSLTTSHGLVIEALSFGRPMVWDPPDDRRTRLQTSLVDASRLTQEATATYTALVLAPDDQRTRTLAELPAEYYRPGYDLFAALLDSRDYDAITRARLTRVLGARAMQTRILDDWVRCGLHDERALARYLAEPDVNPDLRLGAIVEEVSTWDDQRLLVWAGSYRIVGDRPALDPARAEPLDGIDFVPIPTGPALNDAIERIHRTVPAADDELVMPIEFLIRANLAPRVVISPRPIPSFGCSPDDLDPEWLARVDLVRIEANVFAEPIRQPGNEVVTVPPDSAQVYLFAPGHQGAAAMTIALDDVSALIARVPAATLVVGTTALLPRRPAVDARTVDEERAQWIASGPSSWLGGRPYVVWSPMDHLGLIEIAGAVSLLGGMSVDAPWSFHAVLLATNLGLIVARPAGVEHPVVIHTTTVADWDAHLGPLLDNGFQFEPRSDVFFRDDSAVDDISRFIRFFLGQAMGGSQWDDFVAAQRVALRTNQLIARQTPRFTPFS